MSENIFHVRDFGAIPNDGKDDSLAIQNTVSRAVDAGNATVQFEAGDYLVKATANPLDQTSPRFINNIRKIFGPGNYDPSEFNYYAEYAKITASGATGLKLHGAVDRNGDPATRIVNESPFISDEQVRGLFLFAGCDGLLLENLCLTYGPIHGTSGIVTALGPDWVEVDIFEGLPRFDNMPTYCANAWDMESHRLINNINSLTFGSSPSYWRTIDRGDGRRVRIDNVPYASKLREGYGISWWFSLRTFQVIMAASKDVRVENVRIANVPGFGFNTFSCTNVYGNKVVFKSENDHFPVTPRDAWKLAWNDGEVLIENSHFEGVRWDGQNTHGPWFIVVDRESDKTVKFKKEGGRIAPLKRGSEIGFWSGDQLVKRRIADWSYEGKVPNKLREHDHILSITFETEVPSFVKKDTRCAVYCFDIDRYILRNTTCQRIAGAMSIIKNENVLIEGCTFDNIQHPAIVLGTEWQEGTYPRHFVIRDNIFSDSGWIERDGVKGLIGIGGQHKSDDSSFRISDIKITNNVFKDNHLGIDIVRGQDMLIKDNIFENVTVPWQINEASTRNIVIEKNEIIITESGAGTTIINFGDPGYLESEGRWSDSSLLGYNRSNSRYTRGASGSYVKYTPELPEAGEYKVSVFKIFSPTNADSNIQVEIFADGQRHTRKMDFTVGPTDWHTLGSFRFSGQTGDEYIKLTKENANTILRADALKLVRQ
ncbi:right-handed parallel beta-helix repeat-containing protein [Rubellicoccus peritrichatus]|uniref:Golvesin/Xly CBD-like domain-containing protein n=1 Tax=Rubellicoccus peritrichatus TaxID=3080537 RepID=A0AAQ3LG36_9BACT|nr:right-handed parallel beta-helix repeat-containing protein [Puniceicoccus sp. CR14]WOO43183.1 hypothetical protein RZN69_08760 [Puniceicoccus sp. CR14]